MAVTLVPPPGHVHFLQLRLRLLHRILSSTNDLTSQWRAPPTKVRAPPTLVGRDYFGRGPPLGSARSRLGPATMAKRPVACSIEVVSDDEFAGEGLEAEAAVLLELCKVCIARSFVYECHDGGGGDFRG